MATPEASKAERLLRDLQNEYETVLILYGELLKTVSPTRIEPRRKNVHWILFDIYEVKTGRYVDYKCMHQHAYHYKIPIVKFFMYDTCRSLEELEGAITLYLKVCRKHRREGFVIKSYDNQVFAKEKIDLPKLPKIKHVDPTQIQYPDMPPERCLRALQHAYDEVGKDNWSNISIAMPIVARHLSTEAREHYYKPPRNMFKLYLDTPITALQPDAAQQKRGNS